MVAMTTTEAKTTATITTKTFDRRGSSAAVERLTFELEQARQEAANLRTALGSNRTIGMAIGRVMERWQLPQDAAFAVLRRYSQDSNRKLHDIAADLVATGKLPDSPPVQRRTR